MTELSPDSQLLILDALRRDAVLEAVKLWRDDTGDSLLEAKIAIEELRRQLQEGTAPDFEEHLQVSEAKQQQLLPGEVLDEIFAALRRRQKIQAIKLYRESQRCSLVEAKLAVEAYELQLADESDGGEYSPPAVENSSGCLGLMTLIALIAGIAALALITVTTLTFI